MVVGSRLASCHPASISPAASAVVGSGTGGGSSGSPGSTDATDDNRSPQNGSKSGSSGSLPAAAAVTASDRGAQSYLLSFSGSNYPRTGSPRSPPAGAAGVRDGGSSDGTARAGDNDKGANGSQSGHGSSSPAAAAAENGGGSAVDGDDGGSDPGSPAVPVSIWPAL